MLHGTEHLLRQRIAPLPSTGVWGVPGMLARVLIIERDANVTQRLEVLLLQANCHVTVIVDGMLGFLAA